MSHKKKNIQDYVNLQLIKKNTPDNTPYRQKKMLIEDQFIKVLAAVYGPHDMRDTRLRPLQDKVVVNCQYSTAVFRLVDRLID